MEQADGQKSQADPTLTQVAGKVVDELVDPKLPTQVYQDGVQPTLSQLGRAMGTVAGMVNVLLAPLAKKIYASEASVEQFKADIGEKVKHIPEDRRITPPLAIAGPVIEAARFSLEEAELRELFANLIATSMDAARSDLAHPSFVSMLQQITPDEARMMSHMAVVVREPAVQARCVVELFEGRGMSNRIVLARFNLLGIRAGCECPDRADAYITNLERLGLLLVSTGEGAISFTNKAEYKVLEEHPLVVKALEAQERRTVPEGVYRPDRRQIVPGLIMLTPLGRQFCDVCVLSPTQT
jgi:hypothetical protein